VITAAEARPPRLPLWYWHYLNYPQIWLGRAGLSHWKDAAPLMRSLTCLSWLCIVFVKWKNCRPRPGHPRHQPGRRGNEELDKAILSPLFDLAEVLCRRSAARLLFQIQMEEPERSPDVLVEYVRRGPGGGRGWTGSIWFSIVPKSEIAWIYQSHSALGVGSYLGNILLPRRPAEPLCGSTIARCEDSGRIYRHNDMVAHP